MILSLDETYQQAGADFLADHSLLFFSRPSVQQDTIEWAWRKIEILAARRPFLFLVDHAIIELLPRLQLVHKSSTGVDAFDLAALREQHVLLAHNRGVSASCVAEHLILLTLVCLRDKLQYLANMRNGVWQQRPLHASVHQLECRIVGIVGMGAIGCDVAKRTAAFGIHVLAHQQHPWLKACILGGVRWVPPDDLLQESDAVTVKVLLAKETERMIGARELGLMKQTAVLVNAARGRVVDDKALYEALMMVRLWTVDLDAYEQQPTTADDSLLWLQNIPATPQSAGRSLEKNQEQIAAAMGDFKSLMAGRRPRRLLNPNILEGGTSRSGPLH